ncbi:MAG: hypothetical protein R8G01_13315 [Ilumatobacteraceae bacterium]|nr:hypothetical protein [Ilumatobacteraceae bacterium]
MPTNRCPSYRSPNLGTSSPFLYPMNLAIAKKGSTERVVAIDAFRARPDADLGHDSPRRSSTSVSR